MLVKTKAQWNSMMSAVKASRELVVDLETDGLRPGQGHRLIGIALRTADSRTWYAPFRHRSGKNLPLDYLQQLAPYLHDANVTYIGWNYKFDLAMLLADGIPVPAQFEDVMLAHHLHNENRVSYALKKLADELLGEDSSAEQQALKALLKANGLKDASEMCMLTPEQVHQYAEKDVDLTWRMREWVKPRLEAWEPQGVNQWGYFKELCRFARACVLMEIHGLPVDVEWMTKLRAEAEAHVEPMLIRLREIACFDINPRSPAQVKAALFAPASDKATVQTVIDKGPEHRGYAFAVVLQQYKSWVTVISNYYEKYPGLIDLDGKLRTQYNLHRVKTGRISSSEPNLQQVKSWSSEGPGRVKEVFVAPPGKVWLSVDYSQAELRLLTHYTQDRNFLEAFATGEDLHQRVADAMLVDRKVAKTINFGAVYGIGAGALAGQLRITEAKAKEFLETYHAVNPGIRRFYGQAERVARKQGYVQLWTGRVRHIDGSPTAPWHKAMPNIVQGGAAELTRISLTRLTEELDLAACRPILQVHDQLVFELDPEDVPVYAPRIEQVMTDFTDSLRVPITVDLSVGATWGSLEDLDLSTFDPEKYKNFSRGTLQES